MSKLLYLDNAATTKTAPEVVEAMLYRKIRESIQCLQLCRCKQRSDQPAERCNR